MVCGRRLLQNAPQSQESRLQPVDAADRLKPGLQERCILKSVVRIPKSVVRSP